MITEKDLQEAITECLGQRNPNANTCIKLAAFLTIRKELFPDEDNPDSESRIEYSYGSGINNAINYIGDTEFSESIHGKDPDDVLTIMDELMTTLSVINPQLYQSVMRKLH